MITIGFVACGVFIFPNAICRLLESLRDVGVSFAYYFMVMLFDKEIAVTVNQMPTWQLVSSKFAPLTLIPFTWEEFQIKISAYGEVFASMETLREYGYFLSDLLYYISQFLMILTTFLAPAYMLFLMYLRTHNNDYDKESKGVRIVKRISDLTWRKIKRAISIYVKYLKERRMVEWLGVAFY